MSRSWSPATKRLVAVAVVLAGVFVVYLGRSLFTPLVLALLLALVLTPVIEFFHRSFKMPHGLAVAVAYLLFLAGIVIVLLLFVPPLVRSAGDLDVAQIVNSITDWAISTLESMRTMTLFGSEVDLSDSIDPVLDSLRQEGAGGFDIDLGALFGGAWAITSTLFTSVIGVFSTALLSLVMSIYLAGSVDRRARLNMYSIVPEPYTEEVRILGARIARVWTGYLSGQLLVAVIVGALTAFVMWLLGMPGALVIGVIGGFLNIIPTFGPIFASVVAAAVAIVQGSTRFDVSNIVFALIVVGAYAVIQQLESNVITPRVLGGAVDVSPLAILIGILVGFAAAGILGAIVAVPAVATGREILNYILAKLRDDNPFPDGPPPPRRTWAERFRQVRERINGGDDRGRVNESGEDGREAGEADPVPAETDPG